MKKQYKAYHRNKVLVITASDTEDARQQSLAIFQDMSKRQKVYPGQILIKEHQAGDDK